MGFLPIQNNGYITKLSIKFFNDLSLFYFLGTRCRGWGAKQFKIDLIIGKLLLNQPIFYRVDHFVRTAKIYLIKTLKVQEIFTQICTFLSINPSIQQRSIQLLF